MRESGHTGLQQDLRLGKVGGLRRQVGVADARFGGRAVGQLRLRQIDGVVELIFTAPDDRLRVAKFTN